MPNLEPIKRSVVVTATQAHAFDVFTRGIGGWWPARNSIGSAPQTNVTIEPRTGGRWFEETADGRQCNWGEVVVWDPPRRLLLAWKLNAAKGGDGEQCRDVWRYDPHLRTEVEVVFTAIESGRTRVDLEHRNLEQFEHPDAAREHLNADEGWPGLLARFTRCLDVS